MKNWLKQQATEFTAWTGLVLIICALLGLHSSIFWIGVALIAIDDKKAEQYAAKWAVGAQKKIDELF